MANAQQEDFVRRRITELRLSKNISEHKMSLDLDKSGSYIRGITSGALPRGYPVLIRSRKTLYLPASIFRRFPGLSAHP